MNKNSININGILSTLVVGIVLCTCYFACATGTSVLPQSSSTTDIDFTAGSANGAGGSIMINSCIEEYATKIISTKPVDVIFVVDNSGSMSEEIEMINKNINEHFAQTLSNYNIDYRVIMLSNHGVGTLKTCIEEPLSTIPLSTCKNLQPDDPPGNKSGQFYHYSYDVASADSLCLILNTLTNIGGLYGDHFKLAPDGWITWLRPSATKIFIEITDDTSGCAWFPDPSNTLKKKVFSDFSSNFGGQIISMEWDKALTLVAPEQFGTIENRRYIFYSIVGIKEKPNAIDDDTGLSIDPTGNSDDPFLASEGVCVDICDTAVAPGPTYQWLSKMTGGLRFPICKAADFDVIFEKIGSSIDSIVSTACIIDVPESSPKGDIAIETVEVDVEKNGGGTMKLIKVPDASFCTAAGDQYYIDLIDMSVVLCPVTCFSIKAIAENIKLTADCISSIE